MKTMITIAALMLTSAPAFAQMSDTDPQNPLNDPRHAYPEATTCLTQKVATLAKTSKETADIVARVAIYECSRSSEKINMQLSSFGSREAWTLALVVNTRSGV